MDAIFHSAVLWCKGNQGNRGNERILLYFFEGIRSN